MNQNDGIWELTVLAQAAAKEANRIEAERKLIQGPLGPGHLIVIPTKKNLVIHWLIVKRHPEESQLLFAIPCDDNPTVGAPDIRISEDHPWGPLTLRCSFGIWLDTELIGQPKWSGRFGEETLRQVEKVLNQLATGSLTSSDEQSFLFSDPDFLDWLDEVEDSRRAAMEWMEKQGMVFRFLDLAMEAPKGLRPLEKTLSNREPFLSMAAEGGGLRGRIAKLFVESIGPRWGSFGLESNLYVRATDDGIQIVWDGSSAKPPRVTELHEGKFRTRKWSKEDRFLVTEPVSWFNGRIELRIGPGKNRKIVVCK